MCRNVKIVHCCYQHPWCPKIQFIFKIHQGVRWLCREKFGWWQFQDVGCKIIMLVTFSIEEINHQHIKIVTNIKRLQHWYSRREWESSTKGRPTGSNFLRSGPKFYEHPLREFRNNSGQNKTIFLYICFFTWNKLEKYLKFWIMNFIIFFQCIFIFTFTHFLLFYFSTFF